MENDLKRLFDIAMMKIHHRALEEAKYKAPPDKACYRECLI